MRQRDDGRHRCDGLTRRDVLRMGAISAFGLGLSHVSLLGINVRGEERRSSTGAAKSCILIWLDGGPSHLETFDVKPAAPAEVRGPLKDIPTTVPGLRFSECLPRTAEIADQIAVLRSVTSPLGAHNFAAHYMLTGYRPSPVLEYPSFGSTVAFLDQAANISSARQRGGAGLPGRWWTADGQRISARSGAAVFTGK